MATDREQLEQLKKSHGFREPDRGDLDDASIEWRTGKPDYAQANLAFVSGKTQNHQAGSLEEVVENLVKTWEMEASHKKNMSQWTTIDYDNYSIQSNGGCVVDGVTAYEIGNYNALMKDCPAYQKYGIEDDFEKSHELFREAFEDGFPWEVLKVLSGPPHVLFTWRHWARFTGHYRGRQGNGELLELYGIIRVTVNDELKIGKIEAFYDPTSFLETMEGKRDPKDLKGGQVLLGDVHSTAIEKDK